MSSAHPGAGQLLGGWQLAPLPLAVLLGSALLYFTAMRRCRARWPIGRFAAFLGGLLALAIALLSGIDRYSERLLSVHMGQHLLLMLVAPALLILGAPVRLALAATRGEVRRGIASLLHARAVTALVHPAAGFLAFAAVVLATHLSGIYELALSDRRLHALEHAVYFWSGALFLAPLIGSDPLPHRPGPLARFAWLMGGMAVMAVPGALLSFQSTVLYPAYLDAAGAMPGTALADQHLAGALMWIGGGLAMFALAATVVMRGLLAEERRQRHREARLADSPRAAALPVAGRARGVGGR
ncbi:MAG TPA: cytochrome c oxidase assembly protein [Solirubrobacteraceae bacterium]|jgi:cytochrome c oxidase assembly factor CtaG|nr:cytochrome c oxidase assembly protein [Solirubrobacteraceae bacterium]